MAYDCFLSYASQDLAHAESVHARLTAVGFKVWFDKARLQPGYDWHKEIEEGCETSRVILPLLTPRWKQSEWTRYETYGAEAVIPLLVEGRWEDVSTPPLTPFQNFCIPLATAADADWQRLFESIREFCAREVPQKEQRVNCLRYHPAKHFVGREKDLDEIHEKLFVNPTAALTQGHVQAIAAMGGVGKTTLARQYAEKFWRCYPQMFWADCRLGLETEFAAIHDILRPEPVYAELSTKDKAAWVRFEFSQSANRPRRLLILDNADDEESVLEWIPKTGSCHTLITSRFTGWSSGIETYRVWVLDPEPARELLLRRSGRADTPAERGTCDTLAKKLEYLPLALEQAAAYVGAQPPGWGFAEYLRLYEANERALLTKKTPGATEYPDSVYFTWQATMAKLPQGARAILRLHCFLASTPTPVAMFVRGVDRIVEEVKLIAGEAAVPLDEDIEGAGEFAVREWISSLASYSMARLEPNDSFSVHGLVHAVEWQVMGEKRAGVLERTTNLFLAYAEMPSWEPESRRMWNTLLPHATQLNEAHVKLPLPGNIALLDHAWRAHHARGDYRAAILPARQCLVLWELHSGPDDRGTLTSVNNLATLLYYTGDYAAAEPLYRRALEAREHILGPGHPDTLASVNDLAGLLESKGDYAAAEPLCRRALEGRALELGPEHPDTLISVITLAEILASKGDYAAAEPMYRRALEGSERALGIEHPNTLVSVGGLALVLCHKGDFAAAEPLTRRALAISERVLGPEHPDTLTYVDNLAGLQGSKGNYAGAASMHRRALLARERVLGPEHPDTGISRNNLAALLRKEALDAPTDDAITRVAITPDGGRAVSESEDMPSVWNQEIGGADLTGYVYEDADSGFNHAFPTGLFSGAESGDGAPAHNVVSGGLEDFRCSVFYPERVDPRKVSKIVASIHLQEVASVVVREAARRLDLAASERMKAGSAQPKVRIRRHVGIDVTVDIPGLNFETSRSHVQVWEDQQFVEFRFKPTVASAGPLCQGRIYFWLEGVILADVAVSILVTEESVPEIFRDQMAEVNARPYRSVFPSYSHEDADIVEQLESYAAAFGDEYLRDIRRLRAGQRWNDELRGFIKRADVFQLFWSSRAADSEYVGQEWRCGLAERESRPDPYFVRPVYWTDSPAPIPDALKPLHFAKVPLVRTPLVTGTTSTEGQFT